MSCLRPSLIQPAARPDYKSDLGVFLFCLLVAAWLHLVGFMVWQGLGWGLPLGERSWGEDTYSFEFSGEKPTLELTVVMGNPTPEKKVKAGEKPESTTGGTFELGVIDRNIDGNINGNIDGNIDGNIVEPEIIPPAEGDTTPEVANDLATPQAEPQIIDQALARSELRPPTGDANQVASPLVLESQAPKYKSYNTALRRAVNSLWIMSPEALAQFRPSRLVTDFTVSREGQLLSIVVIQSTGNATLDHAGLEAIRSAPPFPPFPPELQQYNQLVIRMHFDYQADYQ